MITPSFIQKFPILVNDAREGYGKVYNALFYTANVHLPDFRNRSIFWEPGVFQYHMIIAFYWQNFEKKMNSPIRIFIYMLGFFTCLSTSGLITFSILLLYYFYKSRSLNVSYIIGVGVVLLSLLITITVKINLLLDITFSRFNVLFFRGRPPNPPILFFRGIPSLFSNTFSSFTFFF